MTRPGLGSDPGALPSLEAESARAAGGEPLEPLAVGDGPRESEAPSSGTFAAEDFLFHLYRGSELLEDNRVGEAKEELERALAFQPQDVEGQGLLGVVYFRLGLYPRAIHIFEEIVHARPQAETPRLNLGLCYLKTGQLLRARDAFSALLEQSPKHKRAAGYLGLAHQRLGEFEQAASAFERAGQPHLARRMHEALSDLLEPGPRPEMQAVRAVAAEAAAELDTDAHAFTRAEQTTGEPALAGHWHPHEIGGDSPPPSRSFKPRASAPPPPPAPAVDVGVPLDPAVRPPPPGLRSPRQLAEHLLITAPADGRVAQSGDEVALIRLDGAFAVRLDRVRALLPEAGQFTQAAILRRARGRELDEPLGGMRTPLVVLDGRGALVVSAEPRLLVTRLSRELFYAREDRVIGFDLSLRHESGRLSIGAMEHVPMVQLSGEGMLALQTSKAVFAVAVSADRPALLRGATVVGWVGRIVPQPAAPGDAAAVQAGLVKMSGDGAVFVDAV
jgi:thioredoxin-like negative regulator of GroEL